jgi:hypothetical protein
MRLFSVSSSNRVYVCDGICFQSILTRLGADLESERATLLSALDQSTTSASRETARCTEIRRQRHLTRRIGAEQCGSGAMLLLHDTLDEEESDRVQRQLAQARLSAHQLRFVNRHGAAAAAAAAEEEAISLEERLVAAEAEHLHGNCV